MTRDEAIAAAGLETVKRAEAVSCEWLCLDGDYSIFSACADSPDGVRVTVYYRQLSEVVTSTEDLGSLDWIPYNYDVD